MTINLTKYGQALASDGLTGRVAVNTFSTYAVLLSAAPTVDTTMATMSEIFTPGTNGYSRVSTNFVGYSNYGVYLQSSTANMGPFTSTPPPIVAAGIVDAQTGTSGNLIAFDVFDNPWVLKVNEGFFLWDCYLGANTSQRSYTQ